jgi:hypothetical protein
MSRHAVHIARDHCLAPERVDAPIAGGRYRSLFEDLAPLCVYRKDDPAKLLLSSGGSDVPRNQEGIAVIGDPRNDVHLFTSQMVVAFINLHNRLVDRLRHDGVAEQDLFEEAQWATTRISWASAPSRPSAPSTGRSRSTSRATRRPSAPSASTRGYPAR